MKEITFRPLRRHKKSGKIIVASYESWHKVKKADYSQFKLVIDKTYKQFDKNEFVFNYQGEQLFFFTYNPDEIPVYNQTGILDIDLQHMPHPWVVNFIDGRNPFYNCHGVDCYGTPAFNHYTANRCADFNDINQFEPLTVGMVDKWVGWFIWQLQNATVEAK